MKGGILGDDVGLHVAPLSALLISSLGLDFMNWDYTALRVELEERWGPVGVQTWQRVMAITLLLKTDLAWTQWEVFENVVATILGEMPIFSYVQPPEPAEISIALYVMNQIADHDLSDEVRAYIVAACLDDGMWYLQGTRLSVGSATLDSSDKDTGIERDYRGVEDALAHASGPYSDPQTPSEVQVNHILDVHLATRAYEEDERKQVKVVNARLRRR